MPHYKVTIEREVTQHTKRVEGSSPSPPTIPLYVQFPRNGNASGASGRDGV